MSPSRIPAILAAMTLVGCESSSPSALGPTATFTATCSALACTFRNASAGGDAPIEHYEWDFGDDTPVATSRDATHTYAAPGRYSVRLTVTDESGETGSIHAELEPRIVTVVPQVPADPPGVPPAQSPAPAVEFIAICTNLSCRFVDQSVGVGPMSHTWDLGDGSGLRSGRDLAHAFPSPGTYSVTLTVVDAIGRIARVNRTVPVSEPNVAPHASFGVNCSDRSCQFTDASTDPNIGGTVVGWLWDFGDGRASTERNPVHEYAADAWYTIRLSVTDDRGATATASRVMRVPAPIPPTVTFDVDCDGPVCTFTNTSTIHTPGFYESYWEFGDGSLAYTWNATHTYSVTAPTSFSVRLSVGDFDLTGASGSRIITVAP